MAERPPRRPRRCFTGRAAGALAAVAAVALATVVAPVGPVTAQEGVGVDGGPCTDGDGVTVVVDFQELGDDTVVVRCAADAPADGFAALSAAGVPYRTTITFPGFLCRIFDQPDDDPCATTAPADAYWSYWLAPAGGDWCYSNRGAGDRTPPPGSVEGWSFALDRTSEDVPPPRLAPPPPVDGTEPAPLAGSDCGLGPTPGVGQTPAAADEPGSGSGTTEGTDGTDGGEDPGAAVGRGGPVDLEADGDDGSPVGTIVGGVAVIALAALAATVAVRRRSTGDAGTSSPPAAPADVPWRYDGPGAGLDEPLPDVTMRARPDDGGNTGPAG